MNNETVGISAEVAICEVYNIKYNFLYKERAEQEIVDIFKLSLINKFEELKIASPIKHIAEGQNPVDFILSDGKTLSVKTNQKQMGKVAPQKVGQPTSQTHFIHFNHLYTENIPNSYIEKVALFKRTAINRIDEFIEIYWDNLFDCDYLIYLYGVLNNDIKINIYEKSQGRKFIKEKFTFTQSENSWNESNTVKYCGVSIGEFQIHNNRDCFKFRFIMEGIDKLFKQ